MAVDYVSKWVETTAMLENDDKGVACLMKKNIFSRFGTRELSSAMSVPIFCKKLFHVLLAKYRLKQHKVATPYHL